MLSVCRGGGGWSDDGGGRVTGHGLRGKGGEVDGSKVGFDRWDY